MKKIFVLMLLMFISGIYSLQQIHAVEMCSYETVVDGNTNSSNFYYNSSTLYQTNYYSTYYFSQLKQNFGNNIKGSCTYVALAMLLSYYDTYWNDSIISEGYDMITMLEENELPLLVESPGIYTEGTDIISPSISTSGYYQAIEQYSNSHFHLKLIQMGKEKFNQYVFDDPVSPCALTLYELESILEYYLYDYMNFTENEISYTVADTNIESFVIENIKNGKPVLVRMGSSTSGHAFILYDYDEVNNELYGHLGWRKVNKDYSHIKLSTTSYNTFWDALVLNVNLPHTCSNNYKYSEEYITTETHCPCIHGKHESNAHIYNRNYVWQNSTKHLSYCGCGNFQMQFHAISSEAYSSGQRYATCLLCGGSAEIGLIQMNANSLLVEKVSINGSFILSNGIIVLNEKDVDLFKIGVLVFYKRGEAPTTY